VNFYHSSGNEISFFSVAFFFSECTEAVSKRSELILELLGERSMMSYEELANILRVSTMTMRRDCDELSRVGSIIKVLGGVRKTKCEFSVHEKATDERIAATALAKRAIAREALSLIKRPLAIFLDGSTTCLAFAKLLDVEHKNLTIVTHSAQICLAMRSGRNNIICAGGEFEPRSLCFVGPQTESFVQSIFVDIAFVSATGVITTEGTFESGPTIFRLKQLAVKQAAEVVLLADYTKFGRRALSKVLDISQINYVITDAQASHAEVAILRRTGVDVKLAEH
jgi:DeoR/GlpR family transcriptional regulator of sugar metabolism